jgi:hypothetical protein
MPEGVVFAERRSTTYDFSPQQDRKLGAILRRGAYPAGLLTHYMLEHCSHVLGDGFGARRDFTPVIVSADSARAEGLIADALALDGRPQPLARALREFFNATALELLCRPDAYFEIVYAHESGTPDALPVAFRLCPVLRGSIGTYRGRPVQFVPRTLADHHTLRGVGYVKLGETQLARFHLDTALEAKLRTAMTALASPTILSDMAADGTAAGSPERPPRREQTASLTAATAPIGWNGGVNPLSKRQLNPYLVYRNLQCLIFKIKIRQSILDCLNAALEQVGHRLQLPLRIELKDVVTLQDVRDAQDALEHGRRTLVDIDRWALTEI